MKTYSISLLLSIGVFVIGIFVYRFFDTQKIGYVKTGVVLQKYQGMLDANKQFESEVSVAKGNIDTLRARFENLQAKEKSIPASKRGEWGYEVGIAEKEYMQYNQAAQEQLQQRQQQLTMNVLNSINNYIQEYGKAHNYRIILGTTNDGSILYGLEQDDLTETILKDLNEKYKKPAEKK